MTDYVQVMINAAFTGMGVAIGQTTYELIIKPRIHKAHKKIRKVIKL